MQNKSIYTPKTYLHS